MIKNRTDKWHFSGQGKLSNIVSNQQPFYLITNKCIACFSASCLFYKSRKYQIVSSLWDLGVEIFRNR